MVSSGAVRNVIDGLYYSIVLILFALYVPQLQVQTGRNCLGRVLCRCSGTGKAHLLPTGTQVQEVQYAMAALCAGPPLLIVH